MKPKFTKIILLHDLLKLYDSPSLHDSPRSIATNTYIMTPMLHTIHYLFHIHLLLNKVIRTASSLYFIIVAVYQPQL